MALRLGLAAAAAAAAAQVSVRRPHALPPPHPPTPPTPAPHHTPPAGGPHSGPHSGLTLDLFSNGALAGTPSSTAVITALDNVSLPGGATFSAEITGTVRLRRNESYAFTCAASEPLTLVLLHVGDHLICQRGAHGGDVGQFQQIERLSALTADTLVFRMSIYSNGTSSSPAGENWVSVTWAKGARPPLHPTRPPAKPPLATVASKSALGYTRWPVQNIDTVHNLPCPSPGCSEPPGVSDNSSQTLAGCIALCEARVSEGCIGFVTQRDTFTNGTENQSGMCYLRGTAPNCPAGNCAPKPNATIASVFSPTQSQSCGQAVWTRDATCKASLATHPPPKPFPLGSCPKPPPKLPPVRLRRLWI